MGTWGSHVFENDAALDWLHELEQRYRRPNLIVPFLTKTLRHVDIQKGWAIEEGVAACEAVSWLIGRGKHDGGLGYLRRMPRVEVPRNVLAQARAFLRQATGARSAFRRVWFRPEDARDWVRNVQNLERRLRFG